MKANQTREIWTWEKAVNDLTLCGFIQDTERVTEGVYRATVSPVGYGAASRELAEHLPGQIRPSSAATGLVWLNGSKVAGAIVDNSAYNEIMVSRETAFDLYGFDPLPYSLGGIARKLLEFIGPKQPYEQSAEYLRRGVPYGYHECTPGKYVSPEPLWLPGPPMRNLYDEPVQNIRNPAFVPPVRMYDVRGYYYQLFQRLESLRFSVYPEKVRKQPMTPNEKARFRDVLACVENDKPLRNSLAGVCAGTLKWKKAYTWDKEKHRVKVINIPPAPGPFRAAGLLLVRTGVELCYMESLTVDSIYSTIDSVVVTGNKRPSVWQSFGLDFSPKSEGNAEICHRGSYIIGPKATEFYRNGEREYTPVKRMAEPSVYYHKSWL